MAAQPASVHSTTSDGARDRDVRMRFLRIDAETGELLREFWKAVDGALPEILEGFYRHVSNEPQLVELIGSDTPRLKKAQGSHWARLFNGRFDSDYLQGARMIGLMHNKIGLEPRWYIGGYNFVLGRLAALAVETYRWRPSRLSRVLVAVNSAVLLDMDIAISVYQEAMLAERRQRQDKVDAAISGFDGRMKRALESVGGSATELQLAANALAANAEQSRQQSQTLAAASEEASTNVQAVAASTEELSSSIREIGRQVSDSTRITATAVDQAKRSGSSIEGLAVATQRIGAVIELINSIAGQTNLLALNATIEAARAGEAGRGFAVVASEVKALAEQTAKATGEIGQQINGIQGATQDSVNAIREISGTIERLSEISSTIAAAVEEQGAATQEIARNVQQAAQGTEQVSSNITDVQRGAADTGSASSQVLSTAQSLSSDSHRLKLEVSKFLGTIRAA